MNSGNALYFLLYLFVLLCSLAMSMFWFMIGGTIRVVQAIFELPERIHQWFSDAWLSIWIDNNLRSMLFTAMLMTTVWLIVF